MEFIGGFVGVKQDRDTLALKPKIGWAVGQCGTQNKEISMSKLNIRPLGDKVIVERSEADDVTSGGIVLPQNAKEKPKRGIVRAIGTGKLLDDGTRSKMEVSKGDEVIFVSYAGTEVKVGKNEYLIMDASEILAIVDNKE